MTDILIDVTGKASVTVGPELAVVHAAITADGPQSAPVAAQVAETLAQIRADLDSLQTSGVIESFTVDQVRLSAQRPWNQDGEQLPLVHSATVALTVTFRDFRSLGEWVTTEGLTVHYIDWRLTDDTRARLERETRQAALSDAVNRAQDYADTLELGPVVVRSVREPGAEPQPRMMMAQAGAAAAFEFTPEDIEVSAEVNATFTVDA